MTDERKSPFEKLYAPIPDTDAYLSRIGFDGKAEPTFDCLKKLMSCHLAAVPFENLDVYHGGIEPSLETDAMFEKIVTNRRGGYCFELNGLFSKLLSAVGFDVSSRAARVLSGRDFVPPRAHRVIVIKISGKSYFYDVGFGGPVPIEPIEIICDKVIDSEPGRKYKFLSSEKGITLLIEKDKSFVPVLMFDKEPSDEADFVPLNAFCAYLAYEPFRKKQMIWLGAEEGRRSIDGDVLRIRKDGTDTEISLDSEEKLRKALKTYFGLEYSGELREWK